jgi:hypothetical protein
MQNPYPQITQIPQMLKRHLPNSAQLRTEPLNNQCNLRNLRNLRIVYLTSACSPFARRSLACCLLRFKPENVARLARERFANRVECGETDRARLAGFEDRDVGQRHSDPVREFGQRHTPIVE